MENKVEQVERAIIDAFKLAMSLKDEDLKDFANNINDKKGECYKAMDALATRIEALFECKYY